MLMMHLIQSIEFSTGDENDEDDTPATTSGASPSSDTQPTTTKTQGGSETLEQLLLARNKKLSNELTILRVSHQDLQSRLETLQNALNTTQDQLGQSQKLTQTLEADLERVQEEASHAFPSSAMSVAGTYRSQYPSNSLRSSRAGGRNVSPTSSIISGFTPQETPEDVLRSGAPVGGGSGMLPMITAQRDRYKKKNSELEGQIQKLDATVSSLRGEVASLQRDNISLYEKSRYVSTYSRGGGGGAAGGSGSAYSAGAPRETSITIGDATADGKYKAAYENSLTPFAAFRGRESARAFKRMSLPERAVFQVTRLVLSTRTSRNLFAGYCLGLHVLLMVMLYNMGGHDSMRGLEVMSEVGAKAGTGVVAEELNDAGII